MSATASSRPTTPGRSGEATAPTGSRRSRSSPSTWLRSLAVFTVVTWEDWLLCALLYLVRMFCITAGYHRYFSHRSFRTGRVVQFLLALGATTAAQKGPLWWAGHHRMHHRYSDLDDDVHSPRDGFWWSHVGWILSTRYKATDLAAIRDFAAYPELRLLDRYSWAPPWALGIACFALGGWGGLLIGFFLSTVLLWHGTFVVNSLTHLFGRRRFATTDTSRNSLVIALITGGEGWHNNHHYLPASVRQGFAWWEFDPTWYTLRVLAALHLVHDLKDPPAAPARSGPGPRRRLRHRDVPFLLGSRGACRRRTDRRPERPSRSRRRRSARDRPAGCGGGEDRAGPSGSHEPLATLAGLIREGPRVRRPARRLHPSGAQGDKTNSTEQGAADRVGE